jgi:deoxyguanosine kinase
MYVYLHKNTELLLRNIAQRGRIYKTYITGEYLEKIAKGYYSYFKQQNDFPILIIDTNNLDFVNDPQDFDKIVFALFKSNHDKGINRIFT